jgi:hypothetical protein
MTIKNATAAVVAAAATILATVLSAQTAATGGPSPASVTGLAYAEFSDTTELKC